MLWFLIFSCTNGFKIVIGRRLVFRSTRNGGDKRYKNLYIMENAKIGEFSGGKIRRLTRGAWTDTHCQWSPRGDWIVFSSTRDKPRDAPEKSIEGDPGYFAVYLVKATDPDVWVRVIKSEYDIAGHVNHPCFSPDGRSIAVSADLAAVSVDPISLPLSLHSVRPYGDIFTVDINTRDIYKNEDIENYTRITHSRYENSTPTWTMYSTSNRYAYWSSDLRDSYVPTCPYTYPEGGESKRRIGHLRIPRRSC